MATMKQYIDLLLENATDEFFFDGKELLYEIGKWIHKAIEKPGALHAALGVPQGEKIPAKKLKVKISDTAKMKKRKILAKTLKKITRKRTGKGEEETE